MVVPLLWCCCCQGGCRSAWPRRVCWHTLQVSVVGVSIERGWHVLTGLAASVGLHMFGNESGDMGSAVRGA